ncbi:DUF3732 domain-containing protein [Thomasclavelia spiroformis]|uniref:DUF3732 domain-containing protein n=1 Tax=Thomasclavelia spiroformis TaxID=29348 RepID=UPI00242DD529|nr:DUF3732 domain-containing protein [Thomasclavelia spiroformis]
MIKIKQVVLWSNTFEKRSITFNTEGITVLIGDGKVGKTSIISIIDYCLASSDCDIPAGLIRRSCSWFGIVILIDETLVLLARKSPNRNNISNDMYFEILQNGDLPKKISANISRLEVRNYLNEYFNLTNLNINSNPYTKDYIPSYRDTIGLNFYPQELLLNKNEYFYKQNQNIHGKNFKLMFPYIMGINSMEDVINKQKLENIKRNILLLKRQKNKNLKLVDEWEIECEEKILYSIKLGIIDKAEIPINFSEKIELLKRAKESVVSEKIPITENSLYRLNKELTNLESRRSKLYSETFNINNRIKFINNQKDQINNFKNQCNESVESKKISDWLLNDTYLIDNISKSEDSYAKKIYYQLINTVKKEEEAMFFYDDLRVSLDKEYLSLLELLKNKLDELSFLEDAIVLYKKNNKEYSDQFSVLNDFYKFYGELDNYIKIYEMLLDTSNYDKQLEELNNEKAIVEAKLNKESNNDENDVELYLNGTLESFLDPLNVEFKTKEQVWFDYDNIEFKFGLTHSGVPLSKIGSGSNSVQYHIAMAMILQIFIHNKVKNKCTFDFLVFDQPSEAYFPTEIDNKKFNQKNKTPEEKENDKESLHSLFSTIANTQKNSCPDLQIIVLEHADKSYWKNKLGDYYTDKIKIIDWKEQSEKLIPLHWISYEYSIENE